MPTDPVILDALIISVKSDVVAAVVSSQSSGGDLTNKYCVWYIVAKELQWLAETVGLDAIARELSLLVDRDTWLRLRIVPELLDQADLTQRRDWLQERVDAYDALTDNVLLDWAREEHPGLQVAIERLREELAEVIAILG